MLSVANKHIMLNVLMLNVLMLNVLMLNVLILNVMLPRCRAAQGAKARIDLPRTNAFLRQWSLL